MVLLLVVGVGYLAISPPDLLRVATNYSAKIVCSNVFVAGRDADEVLAVDVQAPGHPLLKSISINVDESTKTVTAKMFGFVASGSSQYREGLGCTTIHGTELSNSEVEPLARQNNGLWPRGETVNLSQDPELLEILSDETLLGEGHRAVVVVQNGRIIAETYADGFDANTPLLGWSMTKTVTAGIIGTLIKTGKLSLDDRLTDTYSDWERDDRSSISVSSMLAMASGLAWNEAYGSVSNVTRMLFLNEDMAGYAAGFPLAEEIGSTFVYSSGTSTMLARAWQDIVGDTSLTYPREAIFAPLGMTSAVMETDAKDTFVGSSYMYATARDWARYGQFLLQKGTWEGKQLLPLGYTNWMFEPADVSDNDYTNGHMWRRSPGGKPPLEDVVWMAGHDGQSVAISPSQRLVIVRLGLTPSKLGYSPRALAEALISELGSE